MNNKESIKNRMPVWSKILIVIGGTAVFFIIFFFVIDTHVIAGYKQFMRRNMNEFLSDNERYENTEMRVMEGIEFDELEKKAPFKVPRPTWLPEGYELDYIDYRYSEDFYYINYKYVCKNDKSKYINISIATDARSNIEDSILVEYEKTEIGELEVIIMGSSDAEWQAIYINEQGFEISITTLEDKETLLKLIENMS